MSSVPTTSGHPTLVPLTEIPVISEIATREEEETGARATSSKLRAGTTRDRLEAGSRTLVIRSRDATRGTRAENRIAVRTLVEGTVLSRTIFRTPRQVDHRKVLPSRS